MDKEQNPQITTPTPSPAGVSGNSTPAINPAPQAYTQATLPPDTSKSDSTTLFILLTLTFFFGIPFFILLAQEIIDKNYDGGGLGYAILFIFFFPPLVLFSIASIAQAMKMKSRGQKIALGMALKAFGLGLVAAAAIQGMVLLRNVWDSFF
jgi:hypothetical protein